MRKAVLALACAAIAVISAEGAIAQPTRTAEPGAPAPSEPAQPRAELPTPNITVKEDRRVCRRRVRTGTRMGTSRVCRTELEWEQLEDDPALNAEITSETLDVLGADDVSTGDGYGGHETSLGPR